MGLVYLQKATHSDKQFTFKFAPLVCEYLQEGCYAYLMNLSIMTKPYSFHFLVRGSGPRKSRCNFSVGAPAWYIVISALTLCCELLLHGPQVTTNKTLCLPYYPIPKETLPQTGFGTLDPLVSKWRKFCFSPPPLSLSRGRFLVQPEETVVLKVKFNCWTGQKQIPLPWLGLPIQPVQE